MHWVFFPSPDLKIFDASLPFSRPAGREKGFEMSLTTLVDGRGKRSSRRVLVFDSSDSWRRRRHLPGCSEANVSCLRVQLQVHFSSNLATNKLHAPESCGSLCSETQCRIPAFFPVYKVSRRLAAKNSNNSAALGNRIFLMSTNPQTLMN